MSRPVIPQHRVKVRRNHAGNWKNHRADGTFKKSKRGKYNARGEWIDDHFFASGAEARRYEQLKELEREGRIFELELQPQYRCTVNNHLVCIYKADFRYKKKIGTGFGRKLLVEDVKGMVTKEYAIKRKLVHALHPVEIIEIPAASVPRCRFLTADEITDAAA